jgi:hypothetical protein
MQLKNRLAQASDGAKEAVTEGCGKALRGGAFPWRKRGGKRSF